MHSPGKTKKLEKMRWLDFAQAITKSTRDMEVLAQLTRKIDSLIDKKESLEAENMLLRDQLDKERQNKEAVLAKIEHLLGRIQEVNLD